MVNYSKRCKDCGRFINIRQMPHGQWVAFEGEQIHRCEKPVQRETIRPSKPTAPPPIGSPDKKFTPLYPEVPDSPVAPPKPSPPFPSPLPPKTSEEPKRHQKSSTSNIPISPRPAPDRLTFPAAPAKGRANVFSAISGVVTTLLGSAIGLFFMFIGLFSIPLSTLAVMHFTGWSWFSALVIIIISVCVPIIGQLGHLILAVLGAYFLWDANFEWHKAAYPAPQTFNISALSDGELERFKAEVIRPGAEQECKSGAMKSSGFDGKLPERIASRCECIAAEFSKQLTRVDLLSFEKSGEYSLETQQRMKDQLQQACLNRE